MATRVAAAAANRSSVRGGAARSGPVTTGQATVSGGVQKLTVDVSKGYFDPDSVRVEWRAIVRPEIA